MLPLAYDDAPYNLACVAARAGQVDRAIEFIQTGIKNGVCIRTMSQDKDLKNVWTHPVFLCNYLRKLAEISCKGLLIESSRR